MLVVPLENNLCWETSWNDVLLERKRNTTVIIATLCIKHHTEIAGVNCKVLKKVGDKHMGPSVIAYLSGLENFHTTYAQPPLNKILHIHTVGTRRKETHHITQQHSLVL